MTGRRYVRILLGALALAAAGATAWIISLPNQAECRASGRIVDPTERHCTSATGYQQLEEHAFFHATQVVLLALIVLAVAFDPSLDRAPVTPGRAGCLTNDLQDEPRREAPALRGRAGHVSPSEQQLPLRIVLRRPPAGVRFALQHGAATAGGEAELVAIQEADGKRDLAFECTIRVRTGEEGELRCLGSFTHGPTSGRFLYITVGTRAGQPNSPWDRRAKIPLKGITPALLQDTLAKPGAVLEATIEGTLRDGSPTCATRPFVDGGGWTVCSARHRS